MSRSLWKQNLIYLKEFEKLTLEGEVSLQFITPTKIQCFYKDFILLIEADNLQVEIMNDAYSILHITNMNRLQLMRKQNV